METGETLKIFVCETFIVEGGPSHAPPALEFSMPPITRYVASGNLIMDCPWLGARPPTIPFYQVRTKMAVMN